MSIDDGKSYPITGNPDYDAVSFKQVNDPTAWLIRTKAGKVVQTLVHRFDEIDHMGVGFIFGSRPERGRKLEAE
jgi:hypothetical protein